MVFTVCQLVMPFCRTNLDLQRIEPTFYDFFIQNNSVLNKRIVGFQQNLAINFDFSISINPFEYKLDLTCIVLKCKIIKIANIAIGYPLKFFVIISKKWVIDFIVP